MKKHLALYLVILLIMLSALFLGLKRTGILYKWTNKDQVKSKSRNDQVIGIYDRSQQTNQADFSGLQHISIRLDKCNDTEYQSLLSKLNPDKPVLVTLETYGYGDENVLESSLNGDYDEQLKSLCKNIRLQKNTVYLRWNPEMEVPVHLFPWQYQSSETYIKAFRQVASLCRNTAPGIRIIWGTAGYPGADEYWPGEDAVDLIGIAVNTGSEQLATAYPPEKDLQTAIRKKLLRMRFMNKPVLIMSEAHDKQNPVISTQLALAVQGIRSEDSTVYSFIQSNHSEQTGKPEIARKTVIGVYDPTLALALSPAIRVEHLFIDLEHMKDGTFARQFQEVIRRKHDVIVTFEPWKDKSYDESTVLLNTINGLYDKQFTEFYRIISSVKQTVYIRFLHEMEIPIHRYPWQSQDPVLYIKAFRYFMNFNKTKNDHIRKVWGPAGDRGSIEWWPGGDVVDYVSVAIYGLPDKNISDPYKQEMFSSIYNRKVHRMRFTKKPIFITEFGVMGPDDFQQKWLEDAARTIRTHREIAGICYFNLADNPKVWGDIPTPVWSISKETFDHFMQELTMQ